MHCHMKFSSVFSLSLWLWLWLLLLLWLWLLLWLLREEKARREERHETRIPSLPETSLSTESWSYIYIYIYIHKSHGICYVKYGMVQHMVYNIVYKICQDHFARYWAQLGNNFNETIRFVCQTV